MGLYEWLMKLQEPGIAVHEFAAAAYLYAAGVLTATQARDALNLSGSEAQEANTLLQRIQSGALVVDRANAILILAERQIAPYTTVAAVKTALGV